MRIPNLTISEALVSRLNTLNYKQNLYNEQLSSGQRITLLSEDPQAASRILRLRSEQASVQVYSKNSDRALSVAQASFAALDQIRSLNDRAGELATLGSSSTVSAAERKAYAVEVNELIKQAIDAANSKYQGGYVFNGANPDVKPFSENGAAFPGGGPIGPGIPCGFPRPRNPIPAPTSFTTLVSVPSTAGLVAGMTVTGAGVPAGATIVSISPNGKEFVLSKPVTSADGTALTAVSTSVPPVPSVALNSTAFQNVISVPANSSIAAGMGISGAGITADTYITSVATVGGNSVMTVSRAQTAIDGTALTISDEPPKMSVSDSVSVSPFVSGASNAKVLTLISNLVALREGLNNSAGDADGGTAAISAARTALLASENDIIGIIADNSALQTRLESLKAQADARFTNSQSLISKDADVDVAQTMVDLTRTRTSYQAALEAGAQVMKLSLLDYIR